MKLPIEIGGGHQFRVLLDQRGPHDPHATVQIQTEDDSNWFDIGQPFSSHWLDDLIRVLDQAEQHLRLHAEPDASYGYRFKSAGLSKVELDAIAAKIDGALENSAGTIVDLARDVRALLHEVWRSRRGG